MVDVKIDLSKLTIFEAAILGSEQAKANPYILIQVLDKCVEGGLMNRSITEMQDILEQIGREVTLYFSKTLEELADIANKELKKDD